MCVYNDLADKKTENETNGRPLTETRNEVRGSSLLDRTERLVVMGRELHSYGLIDNTDRNI